MVSNFWSRVPFLCALLVAACNNNGGLPIGDLSQPSSDLAAPPANVDLAAPPANVDLTAPAPIIDLALASTDLAVRGPLSVSGKLTDFQDANPIGGAVVTIYRDVAAFAAGVELAHSAPTDSQGKYTLSLPAAPLRIVRANQGGKAISSGNAMITTLPTVEVGVRAYDGAGLGVKTTTRDAIPGLVSVIPDSGACMVLGRIVDSNGVPVAGAHARVIGAGYDSDSNGLLFYFKNIGGSVLPVRTQKVTDTNGAFVALNVPPGDATLSTTAAVPSVAVRAIAGGAVIAELAP